MTSSPLTRRTSISLAICLLCACSDDTSPIGGSDAATSDAAVLEDSAVQADAALEDVAAAVDVVEMPDAAMDAPASDAGTPPLGEPLFPNSVASNDIDFIHGTDPDAYESMTYVGQEPREMPQAPSGGDLIDSAYVYALRFAGDQTVEVWLHSDFGSESAAREYAEKVAPRLGKLPAFMRADVHHVIVHLGDGAAFEEGSAPERFFGLFSENMDLRISNNDLEETVFHETAHLSLDPLYRDTLEYQEAIRLDGGNHITEYAGRVVTEDLAETALFVFALARAPERLPEDVRVWMNTHIPNRVAYLRRIFE